VKRAHGIASPTRSSASPALRRVETAWAKWRRALDAFAYGQRDSYEPAAAALLDAVDAWMRDRGIRRRGTK